MGTLSTCRRAAGAAGRAALTPGERSHHHTLSLLAPCLLGCLLGATSRVPERPMHGGCRNQGVTVARPLCQLPAGRLLDGQLQQTREGHVLSSRHTPKGV